MKKSVTKIQNERLLNWNTSATAENVAPARAAAIKSLIMLFGMDGSSVSRAKNAAILKVKHITKITEVRCPFAGFVLNIIGKNMAKLSGI